MTRSGEAKPRRDQRWLVEATGQWHVFEPLALLGWLHAAAQQTGSCDPFAVQEIAEGAWQLLQQEWPERTALSPEQLRERLAKIVQGLGQPNWAEALLRLPVERFLSSRAATELATPASPRGLQVPPTAGRPLWWHLRQQAESFLAEQNLTQYLPEPLAELHRQGCLHWHGCHHPWELSAARVSMLPEGLENPPLLSATEANLAGCVAQHFPAPEMPRFFLAPGPDIFEHLEAIRGWVGQAVWLWAPEMELAQAQVRVGEVPALVRELVYAARYTGLKLIIAFNTAHWCEPKGNEGELFPRYRFGDWASRLASLRDTMLEALVPWLVSDDIEVLWDISEMGLFQDQQAWRRFLTGLASGKLSVIWPKRRGHCQSSIYRRAEAVLTSLSMNAERLAQHLEIAEPETFLRRLVGLIRLAALGLRVWRNRLQPRLEKLAPPFLLQRAVALVSLSGLERLVAAWFQTVMDGWKWMRRVLGDVRQTLQATLQDSGPECLIVTQSPIWLATVAIEGSARVLANASYLRVVSEAEIPQLRAWWRQCGRCFDDLEVTWVVPDAALCSAEEFAHAIRLWQRLPGLQRLRLVRAVSQQTELFRI